MNQLRKYMSAYNFWWYILTFSMAALSVVFFICMIAGNDVKYIGLVIFLSLFCFGFVQLFRSKRFYKELEESGKLHQAESDFMNAIPMINNRVRLGDHWIFTKGKERLLDYGNIRQIYLHIHKSNFIEKERTLKYVDEKGNHRVLCKLELRGNSDSDVQQIIDIILSKNQNIKLGYE